MIQSNAFSLSNQGETNDLYQDPCIMTETSETSTATHQPRYAKPFAFLTIPSPDLQNSLNDIPFPLIPYNSSLQPPAQPVPQFHQPDPEIHPFGIPLENTEAPWWLQSNDFNDLFGFASSLIPTHELIDLQQASQMLNVSPSNGVIASTQSVGAVHISSIDTQAVQLPPQHCHDTHPFDPSKQRCSVNSISKDTSNSQIFATQNVDELDRILFTPLESRGTSPNPMLHLQQDDFLEFLNLSDCMGPVAVSSPPQNEQMIENMDLFLPDAVDDFVDAHMGADETTETDEDFPLGVSWMEHLSSPVPFRHLESSASPNSPTFSLDSDYNPSKHNSKKSNKHSLLSAFKPNSCFFPATSTSTTFTQAIPTPSNTPKKASIPSIKLPTVTATSIPLSSTLSPVIRQKQQPGPSELALSIHQNNLSPLLPLATTAANEKPPGRKGSSSSRKRETTQKPLVCGICFKGPFASPYSLRSHQKTHSITKEYKCEVCPKEFHRLHDLTRHLAIHARDGHVMRKGMFSSDDVMRYGPCENCGSFFARPDALRRHERKMVCSRRNNE